MNTLAIDSTLAIACLGRGGGFWNSRRIGTEHWRGNGAAPMGSWPLPFRGLLSAAFSHRFPAMQERNPLADFQICHYAFSRP